MVNRNSYLSLLESVNEAVVGPSKAAVAKTPAKPTTGVKWGSTAIGGAKTGTQLASFAAKAKAPVKAKVADTQAASIAKASAQISQPAGAVKTPSVSTVGQTASVIAGKKGATTPSTVSEEWDEVDEILAEALEMFGEEDLVAILENFEETGELPVEFLEIMEAAMPQAPKAKKGKKGDCNY
jgi:hypothetical protein